MRNFVEAGAGSARRPAAGVVAMRLPGARTPPAGARRPITVLVAFATIGSLCSVPFLLATSLAPLILAAALYCFMRATADIAHSRASYGK